MPFLKTRTYTGAGDYRALLTDEGLDDAITGVLDVSTFTRATHYPNGYFPAMLPVRIDDRDVIRPWADVAGAVLGFLKGDFVTDTAAGVDAVEDLNVAVIYHGAINTAFLPVALTVPTTAVQPRFLFAG